VAQGVAGGVVEPRCGRRAVWADRPAQHGSIGPVEKALAKGAEAHGYVGDLWTLPRVAEVIERLTGVAYHPGYVWYLLRNHLHWSWQRPARRAVERDDAAIDQWVTQRWPQLKKAPGASTR
jgi:hypothetical protein